MESIFNVISYQEIEQGLIKPLNCHEKESRLIGMIHALEQVAQDAADVRAALLRSKRLEQVAIGQREGFELASKAGISEQTAKDYVDLLKRDLADLRRSRTGGHI
jgi:endonuclease V-like protein UPF0215 family